MTAHTNTSGAPVDRRWLAGQVAVDALGRDWVCTVSGEPGSWELSGAYVPLPPSGGTVGQVPAIATTGTPPGMVWQDQSGANAGRRTIACPFAFNTVGLLTGAALYSPTVGDILHDAWIVVTTAWDGTTPTADIGTFTDSTVGLWSNSLGPNPDMSHADFNAQSSTDILVSGHSGSLAAQSVQDNGSPPLVFQRPAPGAFPAADPIKVCVSQNGLAGGADPGATRGAAVLYLDISTPQAP